MAEQRYLSSKKRKRQTCTANHPLVGIFTRSKSQIYLHRNRSGRARFDSLPLNLNIAQPLFEKRRTRVLTQDSSSVNDLSCILIKDLRTRRVFSNGFSLGGENEEGKEFGKGIGISESGFCCNSFFDREAIDANLNQTKDNIEKLDMGLSSQDLDLNLKDTDPSLFSEEPKKSEEDDVSNGAGGLGEGYVQSTPPDIEVFIDSKEFEENGEQKVGFATEKQSNESDQWNANINQRNGNNSRIKSFLRPCYRVKLFKAPGSFSYRRLLPYLMDISEDKSCGSKMGQYQKFEKGLVEKPHSTSHGQDILRNKSMGESCASESNDVDHVSDSKSTSIECIKESRMGMDFPHTLTSMAEEWPKPVVNWGIEKFDINACCQEPNLCQNNSVTAISDDKNSIGNGEIAKIDVDSCDPLNVNNLNCSVSLVLEECNSSKDNVDCHNSDYTNQLKAEGVYESHVRDSSEVNNLNHTNADLLHREQNLNLSDAEQRDDDDVEVVDHIDNSNKEYIQMALPDDEIFCKQEVAETGGNGVNHMHNVGNFLGKPLRGSAYRNNNSVDEKTIYSSPTRKLVLNRCSRSKLFKTPGSMGYRRMLPFLMDVMKDNSSASGKDHLLELEKCFEEGPLSPSVISECKEMPIENSNGNDCHPERQTGCHGALPIAVKMASSNDQKPNSTSYAHGDESPKPLHTQQERDVHFQQDISDTARKLETVPETMDIISGSNLPGTALCSLSSSGSFITEDAQQASSLNIEKYCNKSIIEVKNDTKQMEAESLLQSSSRHANSLRLNIPSTVSKKGILKRTPQGCRGPCTCLNCSSFRLHAEKAFEFSRNQMQDAEEVALDLIKELSYVRNMLEKSAFSADGHALVCTSQVKEACRRASDAEELAKNRLSQMNFDLNIHCRVTCAQRPRVTFANYVEEKVLRQSDSDTQSKYRLIRTEKEEKLC